MIHPTLTEWPIQGAGDPLPQPRGGVAPLRHDLALARYLETQAAQRASSGSVRDAWGTVIRLYSRASHTGLAALHTLRGSVSDRRRISIG